MAAFSRKPLCWTDARGNAKLFHLSINMATKGFEPLATGLNSGIFLRPIPP